MTPTTSSAIPIRAARRASNRSFRTPATITAAEPRPGGLQSRPCPRAQLDITPVLVHWTSGLEKGRLFAGGGRAGEEDRARRHGGEAAHDPVESPSGRLDREELPQPGPSVPRPDPGGNAGLDPCGREVRLAARVQVLHLRDLVDPAGGGACA